MNYSINKNKSKPEYIQLYEYIRKDIVSEVYPYGSKLPSKRTIAADTGVSVITVEHAIALLCEEGYIQSRERSGCFVIFRKDGGFAGVETNGPEETVENHLPEKTTTDYCEFRFSVLAKTMRGVLNEYGTLLLQRSPNEGTSYLRSQISLYLARSRGIQVSADQIIIGAGSEYLYSLIVGLLGPDRIFGMESPSYEAIETVYRIAGIRYEKLPLGPDGIQSSALQNSTADVLHLTPYRSFPSQVSASASKRQEYMNWAKKPGRYLIEDDYESEFSILKKPEETLFSRSEHDNIIYMNTFSKSISPSLRVGYMLLPKPLVPVFRERLGSFSCTVSTAIQYVLGDLLKNGDYERHINRVRRARRKELQIK